MTTHNMTLDPITIHDPTGEAYRQCRDGAREMMIRELVRNAIEACETKPRDQRQIRIYGTVVEGVNKLSVWNRGGMDLRTLIAFSNINADTGFKTKNAAGNFGRGAKIASLMSNKLGMRFRSCFDGRVLEVILRVDEDSQQVGRVEVEDAVQGTGFVRDVTSEYPKSPITENYGDVFTLGCDWTEVTLFGNAPDHNTVDRPYPDVPSLAVTGWLWNAIGMRFFNVPPGIDLRVITSVGHLRSEKIQPFWMQFKPLCQLVSEWQANHNCTTVPFELGQIHYIETGNEDKTRISSYFAKTPFGGIVWKDEIHNLHSGTAYNQIVLGSRPWGPLALKWGLVRTYNKVAILVELDDDVAVNDINRTKLRSLSGMEIDPESFADVVRENLPDWVHELERSLEPKEDEHAKNIREHLRELMRDFKNFDDNALAKQKDGSTPSAKTDEGQGAANRGDGASEKRNGLKADPSQPRNASPRRRPMDAPQSQWVDDKWFSAQNVEGMAAKYDRGSNTLFFNEEHPLFLDLVTRLVSKLPGEAPPELVRDIAKPAAKNVVYSHVGTYLVGTLSLSFTDDKTMMTWESIVLTSIMATARISREFEQRIPELRRSYQARMKEVA